MMQVSTLTNDNTTGQNCELVQHAFTRLTVPSDWRTKSPKKTLLLGSPPVHHTASIAAASVWGVHFITWVDLFDSKRVAYDVNLWWVDQVTSMWVFFVRPRDRTDLRFTSLRDNSSRHRGQSNGVFWRSCVTMRKVNKFWGFRKKGERVTSLNEHVLIARIAIMRDDEIAFFARKESFVRV